MRTDSFDSMTISETKRYANRLEDLLDEDWKLKSRELQVRRWKKIHDREIFH